MAIAAIVSILVEKDHRRDICVKEGAPLELAYTDDGGKSWQLVTDFVGDDEEIPTHHCLFAPPDLKNLFFLATSKGRIYRSLDAGQTWHLIENGVWFNAPFKFLYQALDGDRVYAVNQDGIIYSDDFGDTWDIFNLPDFEAK